MPGDKTGREGTTDATLNSFGVRRRLSGRGRRQQTLRKRWWISVKAKVVSCCTHSEICQACTDDEVGQGGPKAGQHPPEKSKADLERQTKAMLKQLTGGWDTVKGQEDGGEGDDQTKGGKNARDGK